MMRWLTLALLVALPAAASSDAAQQRLAELGMEEERAVQVLSRWQAVHGDEGTTALVAVFAQAAAVDAPLDLVADKVVEGLAKGVPVARLLPALASWSVELAAAATEARGLRAELDAGDMSERETVLRVQLVRRTLSQEGWLADLSAGVAGSDLTVRSFLGVAEAVGRLTSVGVSPEVAADHGRRWLRQGVSPREAGVLVQAIELGTASMPAAEAARQVTERALSGMPPDDVLAAMDREMAATPVDADDSRSPTVDGAADGADGGPTPLDGRDLPAARGLERDVEAEGGRQIEDIAEERDGSDDRLNDGRDDAGGSGIDNGPPAGESEPEQELDDGRGAVPQDRDNEETDG